VTREGDVVSEQLSFDLDAAERELDAVRERVAVVIDNPAEVAAAVEDPLAPKPRRPRPARCRCARSLLWAADAFNGEVTCGYCGKPA
jgi:hypothetical protein